jgi:DNA-binding NarL/FixJ family response regulator
MVDAGRSQGNKVSSTNESRMKPITPSEQQIIDLLCLGKTDTDISQILGMDRSKVRRQVTSIRWKLDAENRTQVVAKVLAPHLFTKGNQ